MSCADHYETLGIHPDATADEIRRAYKKKIRDAHPDKPGGDTEQARLLDEARRTLLDPIARAEFDARRLSGDLIDDAIGALADVGERAVERLGVTLQARGRDLVGILRGKASDAIRRRK
ncbi:hypothetical protein DB30_02160 [Enhygromyxa salina]|uniref:J domain-containing protein n=1 Tax=Enhygromyxa salina TaxID=215803 RepID=A0A0C2D8J6_9BACT|nr:J domain-containing protein [Enhygromyxa salina]KIG17945.1 hypothetical protein DB30_02160 [Enhygromyxa salina]